MQEVAITLSTLSGDIQRFSLPAKASVAQGKSWVDAELSRPADLQRWLVDGAILEDSDLLSSIQVADSNGSLQVVCVFLPPTFNVKVKVVKFSPGSQAQTATDVTISVSPAMTIDAAKFEALSAASQALGVGAAEVGKAARLIKGGLHLREENTIEHYHIDPESMLHLIIPRGRGDKNGAQGNASELASNVDDDLSTWAKAETFRRISSSNDSKDTSKDEIVKQNQNGDKESLSPRSRAAASKFNSMGVHRLRPRRSASTPVFKSRTVEDAVPDARADEAEDATTANINAEVAYVETNETLLNSSTDNSPPKPEVAVEIAEQAVTSIIAELSASKEQICAPQKPCEPRTTPSRPARGRPSSRSSRHASAVSLEGTLRSSARSAASLQPSLGMAWPPKAPGSTRPPAMPSSPTVAPHVEMQRPMSRDSEHPNSSSGTSPCLTHQRASLEGSGEASPWVRQWMEQAAAASCISSQPSGDPSPFGGHQFYRLSQGARSLSERPPVKGSSRCRPEGIDRWHFVARRC